MHFVLIQLTLACFWKSVKIPNVLGSVLFGKADTERLNTVLERCCRSRLRSPLINDPSAAANQSSPCAR